VSEEEKKVEAQEPAPNQLTPGVTTSGHVFKKIHTGSGSSKLIIEMLAASSQDRGRTAKTIGMMVSQFGMTLKHECQQCGHVWVEDSEALLKEFDPETLMKDIKRACVSCGSMKLSTMPQKV